MPTIQPIHAGRAESSRSITVYGAPPLSRPPMFYRLWVSQTQPSVEEREGGRDVEGVGSRVGVSAIIGGAGGGVSPGRKIGRKEIKFCPM